jgi:hypothetical protein
MKKISIAILTLLVVLSACKKVPEVNLKYVDVERDLITVGTTTATVQCDYQYIATLKKAYLYYGEGENEADMNAAEMRVVQNTLYVDLVGLKGNTTYSYYYEFHNGFNSMRTVVKSFKTEISGSTTTLPTVITTEVTEITTSSAKGGGEVTNEGSAEVTERGICWSTNENPTLIDNHVAAGMGIGVFAAMMNDLEANTTYHVRAYATNEVGTAYGLDREFTTFGGSSDVPEGAINGLFTINANGDQVYFSKGNLQYQASTNTWRFADNQWDYVGGVDYGTGVEFGTVYEQDEKCNNSLISPSYNGWIDLFGWGTSGWNSGNTYYQPWSSAGYQESNQGELYGPLGEHNLIGDYNYCDWGVYDAISNGGNQAGLWRTLTIEEWDYLFHLRYTTSNIRFVKADIAGVNGVILLPDDWNSTIYTLYETDNGDADYNCNVIDISTWTDVFEANNAIFLPAAGYRDKTSVDYINTQSVYWSTSYGNSNYACNVGFYKSFYYIGNDIFLRYFGLSVRLVQDAKP